MAEPDATQIVAGSGVLYVAPLGTALPVFNVHGEYPITWPVGWVSPGYTDAGIDLVYTPTIKELTVDEEASPVGDILQTEKFHVAAGLAEVTLANLNNAISAATLITNTSGGTVELSVGSKPLSYVMVGIQAPAPGTNKARLVLIQKAIAHTAVSLKYQRKDKVSFQVQFEARKLSGISLFDIIDFTSTAS